METIEQPWVGILLDVAGLRKTLDDVKAPGTAWYGQDKENDLIELGPYYDVQMDRIEKQLAARPRSWSRLISLAVSSALYSSDIKLVRQGLMYLIAYCIAWIEDIDRKADTGWARPSKEPSSK
jgi:hypothetical protein